jgi:hypothetical protein
MGIVHINFPKFDDSFHIYIDNTTSLNVVEVQMLNNENEITANRRFLTNELQNKDLEINFIGEIK